MGETILRHSQVRIRTGLSRCAIYNRVKAKTFPQPIQLGPRAVGFLQSEIDAWIADRIAASRQGDSK
jgi:prophage regulatory protein